MHKFEDGNSWVKLNFVKVTLLVTEALPCPPLLICMWMEVDELVDESG